MKRPSTVSPIVLCMAMVTILWKIEAVESKSTLIANGNQNSGTRVTGKRSALIKRELAEMFFREYSAPTGFNEVARQKRQDEEGAAAVPSTIDVTSEPGITEKPNFSTTSLPTMLPKTTETSEPPIASEEPILAVTDGPIIPPETTETTKLSAVSDEPVTPAISGPIMPPKQTVENPIEMGPGAPSEIDVRKKISEPREETVPSSVGLASVPEVTADTSPKINSTPSPAATHPSTTSAPIDDRPKSSGPNDEVTSTQSDGHMIMPDITTETTPVMGPTPIPATNNPSNDQPNPASTDTRDLVSKKVSSEPVLPLTPLQTPAQLPEEFPPSSETDLRTLAPSLPSTVIDTEQPKTTETVTTILKPLMPPTVTMAPETPETPMLTPTMPATEPPSQNTDKPQGPLEERADANPMFDSVVMDDDKNEEAVVKPKSSPDGVDTFFEPEDEEDDEFMDIRTRQQFKPPGSVDAPRDRNHDYDKPDGNTERRPSAHLPPVKSHPPRSYQPPQHRGRPIQEPPVCPCPYVEFHPRLVRPSGKLARPPVLPSMATSSVPNGPVMVIVKPGSRGTPYKYRFCQLPPDSLNPSLQCRPAQLPPLPRGKS